MARSSIALYTIMFVIWVLLMPLAFVTLYSVIELQGSARQAAKADDRLATLRTINLVKRLDAADQSGDRSASLVSTRRKALIDLFQARAEARASAVDVLTSFGIADANKLCTASPSELQSCQIDKQLATCTADWMKTLSCYDMAMARSREHPESQGDIRALRQQMNSARRQGFAFNQLSQRLQVAQALEADSLFPVAEGFRAFHLPLMRLLFSLPQGVIVACFTCVMAAIGAGVSSLATFLRGGSKQDLLKNFLISPLLGGLTGFMVYFVVSAGTSFLVQPAPADPSQATNSNLSAPALAALGVFAGLAAESAIMWLQSKASAFFKS